MYLDYFYKLGFNTACRSSKIAVTATINTPPTFSITDNKTVCNSAAELMQVTSNLADYNNYTWTTTASLFSNAAATTTYVSGTNTSSVYMKSTTAGSYKVVGIASSSVTGCQNTDTSTFIVMPLPTIKGSPDNICGTIGDAVLSLAPATGYGLGSFQWSQSTNGTTFTPVGTSNTYSANSVTATEYYRMELKDELGNVCITQPTDFTLNVYNPQVLTTTAGARCGTGSVTLNATATAGASLNWYATPSGGNIIGTGNTFNTPIISKTTDYYVTAGQGLSVTSTGMLNANTTATSGAGTTNYGIVFNALSTFKLKSVKVYPVSATNASGTVTVDVIDANSQVLQTKTFNVTGAPATSLTPVVLDLDFTIPAGTNYKIRPGFTGISGLLFEPSGSAPGGNYGYPYNIGGVVSILTSTLTAAPTNTARNDLYYYFYDWQVVVGCESARTTVTATVTAPPSFAISNNTTICNNATKQIDVTTGNTSFDKFTWTTINDLYTDMSASTAYTAGTNATSVYLKTATAGVRSIIGLAENTITGCTNRDTIDIIVMPNPTVTALNQICQSGSTTINLTPATGYGLGTIQWLESNDNVTYTTIASATSNSYTTPTLTATKYYKAQIKDPSGNVCAEPFDTAIVNTPTVVATTPATICAPGVANLSAIASAGSNIVWYAAASGGTPLATGSTYSPTISANTTYYAAATSGSALFNLGLADRVGATTNSGYSDIGLMFSATQPFVLQSVAMYPVATTPSGNVSVTIALRNSSGTTLQSTTVSLPTSVSPGIKTLVPLNFNVPAGTDHRLVVTAATGGGITGFIRELTTGYTYPYTIAGVASITSAYTSGASASYYYYFYDWKVQVGCETARQPVTATINSSACNGVKINAKAYLNHVSGGILNPYLPDLQGLTPASANFPLSDPYSAAPYSTNSRFTHVNNGPVQTTTTTVLSANDGTGNDIVDWVLLQLRTGVSGSTTVAYTQSALLQADGDIVKASDGVSPVEFPNAVPGSYYITVLHRNHLGFRTDATQPLSGTSVSLNFTNNSVALYGSNPTVTVGGVRTMVGGDANLDGAIDSNDKSLWNSTNGLSDDYQATSDFNLDGQVDSTDKSLWNTNNGLSEELD